MNDFDQGSTAQISGKKGFNSSPKVLPNHLRQLRQSFLFDCDCQPYKLGIGPCQWSSRASALAELEPRFWRLLPIPDLLGQHAAGVGHLLHGVQVRMGVASAG